VVGDSVLSSVRITWADAVDYFVESLLDDGHWPTTSNRTSISYWPGVSDDPRVNLLTDFSSRVVFHNALDIESRLATMRQGVAPGVFCGTLTLADGDNVELSAFVDRTTGGSCSSSQLDAADPNCCLSDFHLLNEMTYLVAGGFHPASSASKWGVFDGFEFTAPPVALCGAGEAFNVTAESCFSCSPGSAAEGSGSRFACAACATGKYAPGYGMATCLDCEHGTYSDRRGSTRCKVCPKGATCSEQKSVVVDPGFWTTGAEDSKVHACPFKEFGCPGGNFSGPRCNMGFEGVLCGTCGKGYYISMRGTRGVGTCRECGSASANWFGAVLVFVGIVLIAALAYYSVVYSPARKAQLRGLWRKVTMLSLDAPMAKIVFATFQIVSSVTWYVF
jgi:hypothetical protein